MKIVLIICGAAAVGMAAALATGVYISIKALNAAREM